jgi:hypothetical protein
MAKRSKGHLYAGGKKHRAAVKAQFTKRYGKNKGKYVYGAVVGKVWRERHPGKKSWNAGKHYHIK